MKEIRVCERSQLSDGSLGKIKKILLGPFHSPQITSTYVLVHKHDS